MSWLFVQRLHIFTLFLVCESIFMTFISSLSFITVQRLLTKLQALNFGIFFKIILFRNCFPKRFVIFAWFFGSWVYEHEFQIKFDFCSGPLILAKVWALDLHIFTLFVVCDTIYMTYIPSLSFIPVHSVCRSYGSWTFFSKQFSLK